MRFNIKNICDFSLLALLFVVFGCSDSDPGETRTNSTIKATVEKKPVPPVMIQATLNAIAPDPVRTQIQNLVSFANCVSPLGKYTTQVNTAPDGYMYFKQVFNYKRDPFEAVLTKDSAWYTLGDTTDVLPQKLIFSVRNHAFHNVLLELPERFHDFAIADSVEISKKILYRVKAKDARNNYCAFYIDPASSRLSMWQFINPDNRTDTLSVRFSDWKNTGGFNLPFKVDIVQGGNRLAFNYTTIEINSPNFTKTMLSQSGKKN